MLSERLICTNKNAIAMLHMCLACGYASFCSCGATGCVGCSLIGRESEHSIQPPADLATNAVRSSEVKSQKLEAQMLHFRL